MTTSNIKSALDFIDTYISDIDPAGLLDPFNYKHIAISKWINEPRTKHQEFIDIIRNVFDTTSYMSVSTILNQYLYNEQDIVVSRLIELNAPEIILENAIAHKERLRTNTNNAHILVSMLDISISILD